MESDSAHDLCEY